MTTQRQIEKLVKPLRERHANLAPMRNWIVLRPIDHVLCGIRFGRTWSANRLRPYWSVTHFCEPLDYIPNSWGGIIFPRDHDGWLWDDPHMPQRLTDQIENIFLPKLRALQDFRQYMEYVSSAENFESNNLTLFPFRNAAAQAAFGNFAAAREICERHLPREPFYEGHDDKPAFDRIIKQLYPLLRADDEAGVAELLRNWEGQMMRNLGIEDIWTPTPFPFERRTSVA